MTFTDVLAPLLLFTVSTTLTPGPNNFMLLHAGLHFGVRRSLGLYFGICLGFPLMVLLVALGFGVLFLEHSWIKTALKILGSLYMLYLAFQIANSQSQTKTNKPKKSLNLFQAILFQWVNPKAWLMAIGAISIFTLSANLYLNAALLSLSFLLVCLPCLAFWLVGGSFLQKLLKTEKHYRYFSFAMAAGLVASIIMIWVE